LKVNFSLPCFVHAHAFPICWSSPIHVHAWIVQLFCLFVQSVGVVLYMCSSMIRLYNLCHGLSNLLVLCCCFGTFGYRCAAVYPLVLCQ
jgi:hypothetical protein